MTVYILIAVCCLLAGGCVGLLVALSAARERLKESKAMYNESLAQTRERYEKSLEDLKDGHEKALQQQISAVKAEMRAESEEVLKKREEELSKKAAESFGSLTGALGKDLKDMKEAFEANKKAQTESSAAMKENLEGAIRRLEKQSESIGGKADHLAQALRGQNKMQGCWGETVLLRLLENEGFIEGVNYDKESTLRDELGFVIPNEDSGKRMRPDFILHFPDDNDVIVDAKVSLTAYSDYLEAGDDAAREDAAKRNLAAIQEQVKNLSGKDYTSYLRPGHRMLDYSIMFVPNYPALQLAYSLDKNVWHEAYARKVLITTEETLMPFLRMITIAWTNVEQVRNQQQIVDAAQTMIARVHDFVKYYATVGDKLQDALKAYENGDKKLRDSGQSIVLSAKKVVSLKVPENPSKRISDLSLSSE
ncbi:MAG: DNA recombination protein RmuC [Bacteroidales bacterium]|nr:DNA recombination protein RmuC [Bacteroidales bacterium]